MENQNHHFAWHYCGTYIQHIEGETIEDSMKEKAYKMHCGEVWGAPCTTKIGQHEINYTDKREAALFYQAVRNEYESNQLIITAGKDIASFKLKVADLKKGKDILSRANVEVYVQKYSSYNENVYGEGTMPDALIPMKAADTYRENEIKAGTNGALWITIYIPKSTKAGVYHGIFELVINGENVNIPVSVKVYDYTLSDTISAKTLFTWRYDRVATGELDGSIEMMRTYYEFYLNYRVSLQALPVETLSVEEYVDAALRYYGRMTTFTLVSRKGAQAGGLEERKELVEEMILGLAKASVAGKNLLDKAMIYLQDEPPLNEEPARKKLIEASVKMTEKLEGCVEIIEKDESGLYANFKKITNWKQTVLDIPRVVPLNTFMWMLENEYTEDVQTLFRVMNCPCPQFYEVPESKIEQIERIRKEHHLGLWWYGCMGPKAPAPTYHIGDKNLLSARTVSWLQRKYKIQGNLYWDTGGYTMINEDEYTQYTNIYENSYRDPTGKWPAGDGFLTYPGAAYGVYGPLPSVRLMSIRDGMEEYELLGNLETELESKYGKALSEQVMNSFYDRIRVTGVREANHMRKDGEKGLDFEQVRTELLELLCKVTTGLECFEESGKELIFSFESYEHITGAGVYLGNDFGATQINKDKRYIAEGKGSWRIQPQGDYGIADRYPFFRMRCKNTTFNWIGNGQM